MEATWSVEKIPNAAVSAALSLLFMLKNVNKNSGSMFVHVIVYAQKQ